MTLGVTLLLGVPALARQNGDITLDELTTMVRELEAKAPKNQDYQYPIRIILSDDDVLNAQAFVAQADKEGEKPQTVVRVYQKFARFIGSDRRLLRAVLAHEVSHLSRGHVSKGFSPKDLSLIHTRQQEMDADMCGAALLQSAGYDKKDMIDFLALAEEKLRGRGSWVTESLSDHPSFQARIANIADNPNVARSLAEFDYGLMFLDAHSYDAAYKAFERSIDKQPNFAPAYVNAAQAKLQFYYETALPGLTRQAWFLVDFGPALTSRTGARGIGDLSEARKAYREAIEALDKARAKDKDNVRLAELTALAQVIDPDGDPKKLTDGTAALRSMADKATDPEEKLRYANNAAVGMQRSGRLNDAIAIMIAAEKSTVKDDKLVVNFVLAENLGATELKSVDKEAASVVLGVLQTYLTYRPSSNSYNKVLSNFNAIGKNFGLTLKAPEPARTAYCHVASLNYKGKFIGLTTPTEDLLAQFGKPTKIFAYDELFKDLREMVWDSSDLTVITGKDGVFRVTSYGKDAEIVLHEVRPGGVDIKVKVGDKLSDLTAKLGVEPVEVPFVRAGRIEDWLYFSELGFGVLVDDQKVITGLTASPANVD